MLASAVSYCNPFSQEYKEIVKDFSELTLSQKICTVVASIFALLITLPIFGLGGIVAFRYLTNNFYQNFYQDTPQSQGLYLKRECECLSMTKKIGTYGSFNIIQIIDEKAISCLKCSEKDAEHLFVIVKDLDHEISYQEKTGNCESVDKEVVVEKGHIKVYPLNAYYAYFQLEISDG